MLEDRITIDPEISHGRPVIKGTRVPLEIVLGSLAGGMEINEVADEYGLVREDVLAAIAYAPTAGARGLCPVGRWQGGKMTR